MIKPIQVLLLIITCLPVSVFSDEFEWAKEAREKGPSPAAKAVYDRAVADQAAKRQARLDELAKEDAFRKQHEAEEEALAAQQELERRVIEKACGNDYGKIRIGMSLSSIQKCAGDFQLQGQVRRKEGVVDYYTDDGRYLYVKNGKVIAWGN